MIHVLIVDDHPTVGAGTKFTIEQQDDIQADVVIESEKVIEMMDREKYDVYLVDLFMPILNGIELTKAILRKDPEALVLIYTGYDILPHYNLMMEAGVAGFLSKTATSEQVITAIRCVLREEVVIPLHLLKQLRRMETKTSPTHEENLSEITLTEREQQILEQVGEGLTNTAIALNMNMSSRTIELSLTKVFTKLGVGSRTEAFNKAQKYGLLSVETIE